MISSDSQQSRTSSQCTPIVSWLLSIGAALAIVIGWWLPSTSIGAAFAWTSVLLFVSSLLQPYRLLLRTFIAGSLVYLGGFYWLFNTIADFGGFPPFPATAIFLLFVFGSAVQFLIFAFLFKHAPRSFEIAGIRSACAWLVAQQLWIRIFPWDFGHTQIGFLQLAQIADIGGVWLITFLMFWLVEAFVARRSSSLSSKILAASSLIASIAYGFYQLSYIPQQSGDQLYTVTVQGNVTIEQRQNMSFFSVRRDRYDRISKESTRADALIIWPESTILDFIPDDVGHARNSLLLPFLNDGSAFLVGGLSYRDERTMFNTSFLITPDGGVPEPYHKMILMPFGEYTPLGDVLPFIKEINATAAQFTPGNSPKVMRYTTSTGTKVALSPLICYEDIVPTIGRDAVRMGAQLLVNQTNDAWFGDSVAPYQHHMIAAFRAIENRRFLIRSTNTGLTGIVDPTGQTLVQLPPFTEGVLEMPVTLLTTRTVFTQFGVEGFWWILSVLVVIVTLTRGVTRGASTSR